MQDLLSGLNEPQRRGVTHVDGPLLVLAGAGSGKTRVITRRVAYLVSQGISPHHILAITFTNTAAGEMQQRVDALAVPRGATLCTFHSLCARLLREFADEARLDGNYSIYDRDDQLKLAKDVVKKLNVPAEKFTPARVLTAISNAKNEMKTPSGFAAEAPDTPYGRRMADLYAAYQKTLEDNNALDFDDLLLRMAFLLRDRPDVRELLGERYRYILIDEYQDTNHAQYILAHGIAMRHENVCVTGDPDQSIYAWRGANIRNILEFEADYPNAVVIRLEENYRSTAPILAAASRLISHNTQRKAKALWTRREGGSNVRVMLCDDEHAEARQVARLIEARRSAGGRHDEAAVFYRVNSLSRVLEEEFRRAGLAYRIARGTEFYNRKEVKDALAYLRLLANPADDLSCLRILNVPTRGIGATTAGRLVEAAEARGQSLLETCRDPQTAGLKSAPAKKASAFAAMIDSLASRLDRPVKKVVRDVLAETGLRESLLDEGEEDSPASRNVDEVVSTAAEFDQANPDARLADFLHQVALVSDVDRFEGAGGAVTFMTLHAAKGLEFPAVFVVGCELGLLPMVRQPDNARLALSGASSRPDKEMEEERRLAFVGMTRAKNELTLTCARRRRVRGVRMPQTASPFLDEIAGECVSVEDRTTEPTAGYVARRHRRGGFYDDVDERAAIEQAETTRRRLAGRGESADAPAPPDEYERLVVNSRIAHPKFGPGKVLRLRNPWPETRADILFDRLGRKTIVLRHTRLEVLDPEDW